MVMKDFQLSADYGTYLSRSEVRCAIEKSSRNLRIFKSLYVNCRGYYICRSV
jgi:hypothetical protein